MESSGWLWMAVTHWTETALAVVVKQGSVYICKCASLECLGRDAGRV